MYGCLVREDVFSSCMLGCTQFPLYFTASNIRSGRSTVDFFFRQVFAKNAGEDTESKGENEDRSLMVSVQPEVAAPTAPAGAAKPTKSRSRRKPARPKCSAGGDDQVLRCIII